VSSGAERSDVRLAEVVAVLSLATDLGYGQPMEHVLPPCLLALRLSERLGLGESERSVVYYVGLLACVSVKPDNADEIQPDVDGALVGGPSLEPESLAGVIAAVPEP
jgi:Triosephosphate isomerase